MTALLDATVAAARISAAAMVRAKLAASRKPATDAMQLAHASADTPAIDDYPTLASSIKEPHEGYVALGYKGLLNVLWSTRRRCIDYVDINTVNPGWAEAFCGHDWLYRNYWENGKDGAAGKMRLGKLRSAIIADCEAVGHYNEGSTVGAGVFKTPEGRIVVNSGASLWSPDGNAVSRVGQAGVFMEGRPLVFNQATTPATDSEVRELVRTLDTWRYGHPADAALTLGWAATAPFCGMLRRRPILLITGVGGAGKSSLLDLLRGLYGKGRLAFSGTRTTAAGIEQSMGRDVVPSVTDEYGDNYGESQRENSRISALQSQARGAYGDASDGDAKGTSDLRGTTFSNHHSTLFAGIYTPPMEPQDAQRTIQVRINKIHKAIGNKGLPELCCNPARVTYLGAAVCARMLRDWALFEQSLEAVYSLILRKGLGDGRTGDTLAVPLAGWFVLTHGQAITTEEADQLISELRITDKVALLESINDERNCADYICGHRAVGDATSIGDMLRTIYDAKAKDAGLIGCYRGTLEGMGLKVDGTALQICATKTHSGMRALFDKTPFANGRHAIALERAPGARFCEPRLDGRSTKAIAISLAWVLGEDTPSVQGKLPY